MKKIIVTASIAALGISGAHAAYAPGLSSVERTKPWSVSLALRGFYDDNYATINESYRKKEKLDKPDSFGFEVSPTASLNLPMEKTMVGLSYTYSMKYYENRNNSADHSHQVNAKINHAFTEDYNIDLSDSFVVAQEAELLCKEGDPRTLLRANGNNIRNTAGAKLSGKLTEQFGFLVGYENSIYDYQDDRYEKYLDRMEHLATFNIRWRVLEQTIGILGYQLGYNDFNASGTIPVPTKTNTFINVSPSIRDNRSHYAYVGVDQALTTQLNASVRVGAQYTEYPNVNDYNTGVNFKKDTTIPYADARVSYTYLPGSYAQLGVKHTRGAIDLEALDQEATTVYAVLNHKITEKLNANLIAQYQNGTYQNYYGQGTVNDDITDDYYSLGLNVSYQINQFIAAETGYNFDRLDSDVPNRSFTRNRVYVGVRASY